ncbi:MAG: exodeoxyribonuclease VII large subunit [Clostridia bacterium]|nr:exodeoxyribonuclease VII large subunit [Clostridia bacterium]
MQILSVKQLTLHIKKLLESDWRLHNVWVKGEISNFKDHSSGHLYLTLKDEASAIKGVMFRSKASSLAFRPENGMRVLARGYVGLYERDGQYQLYIEEMQPDGIGALHIAFEQLKKGLEAEGLFEQQHKQPLPMLPRRIGIVTSPTGAAVRDILQIIRRRFPGLHLILAPVLVQGEKAPEEIARAIRELNDRDLVDVIIVGRGGGSLEELWAFNTEVVARSIFTSRIPVVSAVGHETDYTIADFVADLRAPTPSAAAELVVPDRLELLRYLGSLEQRLELAVKGRLGRLEQRVAFYANHPLFNRPKDRIYQLQQQVDNLMRYLQYQVQQNTEKKGRGFSVLLSRLEALSPLQTLQRGYAIACSQDGRVITGTQQVSLGEDIEVIVSDGRLKCGIKEISIGGGDDG